MKTGYAQDVITPSFDNPFFLAGLGNTRRAETIHDDLYVRAPASNQEDTGECEGNTESNLN